MFSDQNSLSLDSTQQNIIDYDQHHLWHPYTQMNDTTPSYLVESANGCLINIAGIGDVIDGMASWWSALHGYNQPQLNQALSAQIEQFSHVMFGGLTHRPAVELAEKLIALTDQQLKCIFYSDSGSVSVEVALKMAIQYWQGEGVNNKKKLMTFRKGYHGDTFATMTLSDPDNGMHQRFQGLLYEPIFVDSPAPGFDREISTEYSEYLESMFQQHGEQVAAMVVEPLVQNAGGMNIYSPQVLIRLRQLCDQYDVLLILDEIATGFGRTGRFFAYQWANIYPDILCIGKAMTAGYLSFAATMTRQSIADSISKDGAPLMHGPTYMGNPLGCSLASTNIDLLASSHWQENVHRIETILTNRLIPLKCTSVVKDVRVLGAIGVIEVGRAIDVKKAQSELLKLGVWLRPFRNLLYCMPPYIISDAQLNKLCDAMTRIIQNDNF